MIWKITVDYGGSWTRMDGTNRLGKNLRSLKIKSKPLSLLPLTLKSVFKLWNLKDLPHLVIGAKSVWTEREKTRLFKHVKPLADRVQVMSDVELAYRKAFGSKPGILILAGTGSIALGRGPSGKIARAGGLGPKKGDDGSGYWIGKVYSQRVLKNRKKKSVQDWAALAPQVIRQAQAGHPQSREIIEQAQAHLIQLIASVRRKLNPGFALGVSPKIFRRRPRPNANSGLNPEGESLQVRWAGGLFENAYFRNGFRISLAHSRR